jgi:hypothetical protein
VFAFMDLVIATARQYFPAECSNFPLDAACDHTEALFKGLSKSPAIREYIAMYLGLKLRGIVGGPAGRVGNNQVKQVRS